MEVAIGIALDEYVYSVYRIDRGVANARSTLCASRSSARCAVEGLA
jgi:hypothetical protein